VDSLQLARSRPARNSDRRVGLCALPVGAERGTRRGVEDSCGTRYETVPGGRVQFIEDVRRALYCSKIVSYAQGYMLLKAAAQEHGWKLNMGGIALMWRGGCIIRSQFLGKIKEAYDKKPVPENLLLDNFFSAAISGYQASWRAALVHAIELGVPTPAFSTALRVL